MSSPQSIKQIPLIAGQYKSSKDLHTAKPINAFPVVQETGIDSLFYKTAQGIDEVLKIEGNDRGGTIWYDPIAKREFVYRAIGSQLVRIDENTYTKIADIEGLDFVTFAISLNYLAFTAGGKLYLYNGNVVQRVNTTEVDAGYIISVSWINGYFIFCDADNLYATDILNPLKVIVGAYDGAEFDSDKLVGVSAFRTNLFGIGRYSIQEFSQVGGGLAFPFQSIPATVQRGALNPKSFILVNKDTLCFVGSGRGESIGIYSVSDGNTTKISSRDEDDILQRSDVDSIRLETLVIEDHVFLICHTNLVSMWLDMRGSVIAKQQLWHYRSASFRTDVNEYRFYPAQSFIYFGGQVQCVNPITGQIGVFTNNTNRLWGQLNNWQFISPFMHNNGLSFQIYQHELVVVDFESRFNDAPIIERRISTDGYTWGQPDRVIVAEKTVAINPVLSRNYVLLKWSGNERMTILSSLARIASLKV